jgi:hypothetical protein
MIRESIKEIANEVLKSIHTIRSGERPHTVFLSGGASLFKDTEKILFDLTGFTFKRYDFLDIEQEIYIYIVCECVPIGICLHCGFAGSKLQVMIVNTHVGIYNM